ncbi:hypothetical protein E3N88_22628 [Mikania micrantha]|uniref:AB hydrolase-1 domain-containing protein n=1 Tax=Mikania micrantha TaxID=192012 RepID=A0A5N6NCM0_9ASTR|nr:hypothetical protein E3N88_22628 [Mikania micrantha]
MMDYHCLYRLLFFRRIIPISGIISRFAVNFADATLSLYFGTVACRNPPSISTTTKPHCTFGPPITGAATNRTSSSSTDLAGTPNGSSFCRYAKCVCDGLKKMKVDKFSVYAISYGGFVGYRMAEVKEEMVEKLVIVSSGIVCKHDRKLEHVKKIGRSVVDLLVAKTPEDLRMLCRMSIHKCDIGRWIPDFFLWGFIAVECCRKEKEELVEELLTDQPEDVDLPVLTQETLLIWGEKDTVFPLDWAYQLQRHLGKKSRLEIIRNVGHAANFEAPYSLNRYITTFLLGSSKLQI